MTTVKILQRRKSKLGKITFWVSSLGPHTLCPCTSGANQFHKPNDNCCYYENQTHAHVYVPHNYNSEPFAPIGMESLVHDKPRQPKLFAEHCKKGYVLGTSFENYSTWNIWMKASHATRISATVFHKHKYLPNPTVTPAHAVIVAIATLNNYQHLQ